MVTENIGSTTTDNNDAHVRVWVARIPADGNYNITTDGQVNGYINPRLAFGHSSPYGFLVWVFVGMFVVGLVGLIVSGGGWLALGARRRRRWWRGRPIFPNTLRVAPCDARGTRADQHRRCV